MWVVVLVVVVALLAVAALHDWRARRTGNEYRTSRAYWDGVRDARRETRQERAAALLGRRPRPPKRL